MTNIKYSKRFKLRNGERVDFCPGRKFIGFEISAEYCDIAEKRIASVGKDIPLFEAD